MIKKRDHTEPSNTFILTFSTPTPPKFVKAAYLHISVNVFVPNPLRCYKCQRFGHGRDACKRPAACARCGGSDHTDTDCHADPHCVNCSGAHTCYSKDCPEGNKQRGISKIKQEKQVSFAEAKQIVERQPVASAVRGAISYAKASTPNTQKICPTKTIETQTELTWPFDSSCLFPST